MPQLTLDNGLKTCYIRFMTKRRNKVIPRKWIRTTIEEPFPVMYSHVSQECRRANDPKTKGPFYNAGSEWYTFFGDKEMAHAQTAAEHLRMDGYTVTVDIVER